jgi:predicted nucleotidyltransferase
LPGVLNDLPVSIAYLYGSAASGKTTSLSDIDIALVLTPDCALDPYGRFMLELEVEAEIETQLGIHNADVRCIDTAPLRVQGRVLLEGVLLFARDNSFRVSYETQTRKQYFDFQPVLTMMRQARSARRAAELKERGHHG